MEWFGITKYGPQSLFKDMIKSEYVEPSEPKDMVDVYESGDKKKPFASSVSDLDVYIGQADGYTYKSYDRLIRMRKKANLKPVGPKEMYKYPGCASMDYGWFLNDPALKDQAWLKSENKFI